MGPTLTVFPRLELQRKPLVERTRSAPSGGQSWNPTTDTNTGAAQRDDTNTAYNSGFYEGQKLTVGNKLVNVSVRFNI